MTQPAKVQEPSMEEILASIRRIIADDEAKPAAAEKPASPPAAAKPAVMKDIPPSAIAPAPKPVAAPKPAPPPPAPAPEPVVSNNQDDIDAMLASLDAATPEADIRPAAKPEPEPDVFELTDEMALPEPAPAPPRQPSARSNRRTTSNSPKPRRHVARRPMSRRSRALRQPDPFYRIRPSPPSNPPSTRWPTPC